MISNLLVIAHSEGEYSVDEKRLIRYVAMKSGVKKAVLLKMEETYGRR